MGCDSDATEEQDAKVITRGKRKDNRGCGSRAGQEARGPLAASWVISTILLTVNDLTFTLWENVLVAAVNCFSVAT
jgi:hypothetical protein